MSVQNESPAVAIARAHVEAWGRHDFDTARSMLAPDVRVRVTTTAPYPPDTDLTGAEAYMEGLHAYAEPIVPGSVRVLASTGDDRNALLLLSLTMAGGPFRRGDNRSLRAAVPDRRQRQDHGRAGRLLPGPGLTRRGGRAVPLPAPLAAEDLRARARKLARRL